MYKAIIFDLDGTLLNTIHDLAEAGNYALTTLGYPTHSPNDYQAMVGDGIPKLVERMLPKEVYTSEVSSKALSLFMRYYKEHSEDKTVPYEGILALLEQLKQDQYILGVLTNKEDFIAQEVVSEIFPNTFTKICGYVQGIPPKPDPTRLFELCDTFSVSKEEVLYVGDSEVDMLTARNGNVTSCGVLWGYRSKEQLLSIGANFFIEEPMELMEYLKKENGKM